MNDALRDILKIIETAPGLTQQERDEMSNSVTELEKQLSIVEFKLQRTEQVRRTTTVLLEETIQELEAKRKAIEEKNRELEVEAALERVRSRTMGMQKSEELKDVIRVVYEQFVQLKIKVDHTGFILDYRNRDDMHIWLADDRAVPFEVTIPYFDCAHWNSFVEAKATGRDFFANHLGFEEKNKFYQDLFKVIAAPEEVKEYYLACPGLAISTVLLDNVGLYIENFSGIPYTESENSTLMRFGKVFQQTYTRFLDLQKAEAQAREAQIEAALERVRSRTMAMQRSEELPETSFLLFREFKNLGANAEQISIVVINEEEGVAELSATIHGSSLQRVHKISLDEPIVMRKLYAAWKKKTRSVVIEVAGKKLREYNIYRNKITGQKTFPEVTAPGDRWIVSAAYYSKGVLSFSSTEPPQADILDLLERFAGVFDLTYTRFLDLKTAEGQAREAEIQLSLERVRARTMAMHHSHELTEASSVLFHELQRLGIHPLRSGFGVYQEENQAIQLWLTGTAGQTGESAVLGAIPLDAHPAITKNYEAWKKKKAMRVQEFSLEEVKDYYRAISEHLHLPIQPSYPPKLVFSVFFFSEGSLNVMTEEKLTDEEQKIMLRFANVFGQTYRRYLDLQNAEALARESQIDVAVERVRARALGMHQSSELQEVVVTLKAELARLQISGLAAATLYLEQDDGSIRIVDLSTGEDEESGFQMKLDKLFRLEETHPKLWIRRIWNMQEKYSVFEVDGEDFDRVIEWLYSMDAAEAAVAEKIIRESGIQKAWLPTVRLEKGRMNIDLLAPPTPEIGTILLKMAAGFDFAYRRFLDLRMSEEQAREAQIEVGLERVRAKAMAMHRSGDLNAAVSVVFEELARLNLNVMRCGIGIMNRANRHAEVWVTTITSEGPVVQVSGDESFDIHPLLTGAFNAWCDGEEEYSYILEGEDMVRYYQALGDTNFHLPESELRLTAGSVERQYYYVALFEYGGLFAFCHTAFTDEAMRVIRRFAGVFNLTYKRFLDIQKAETQAREAQTEAALERVRARALAMQQPEELREVAAVLRTEMGLLGVEELETSSIFIRPEESTVIECWYALQDAHDSKKQIITDYFQMDMVETGVGRQMLQFFESKEKQASIVMEGDFRKEWIRYCCTRSPLISNFYKGNIPSRTYHLYKFSHGAIGAAVAGEISKESWNMLRRAASVFSLAYSRFRDLTQARLDLERLKQEKHRAEAALAELQATQKQLIQSEKMASLGELTAGIAHEIQNPLNFVNNFAEVSNELIEEMKQEIEKGNHAAAEAIASDLHQNLEKINQHGRRADAIVKSMLQHSRAGGGQKEPTDINALADEYLRLAYHGFRAKDKSFQAKFETDLDPTIEKLTLVPQDIGRVILNLINNAFYAVTEKRKLHPGGYDPTVTVSTHRNADKVVIRVRDNGNGIPQDLVGKIFQPFFTTKPTGQGTGLGLSLSYDIITKGHGGELQVHTEEGKGSEFVIQLPITQNVPA